MAFTYTTEYTIDYSSENESTAFKLTEVTLTDMLLSERSQIQKSTHCV